MARGSKKSYTSKQRRRAKHIEDSEKKSGKSAKTAARIAYATINKEEGGGKKGGKRKKGGKKSSGKKKTSGKKSSGKRKSRS